MNANDAFSWLAGTPMPEGAEELNHDMQVAAAEEAMIPARTIFAAFSTPEGAEALSILRDRTVGVPLMDVSRSMVQGEVALSPAEWAYVRAGQNSVVEFIEAQMELARNPPQVLRDAATKETHDA